MVAPLLRLVGVDVRFGDTHALRGINLDVAPGERVALVGPSGAGKSTLLGLCNATAVPSTGHVEFRGEPVVDTDAWRRSQGRLIGTVHQQLNLVPSLRVVHNVNAGRLAQWSTAKALFSLVRPQETSRAHDALQAVGIADKINMRTHQLSGGEQQRVAIARVLVQGPALVLADEPVAALDPARADEVVALLVGQAARVDSALLISLHTFALARRHCDRIVGLRDGVVVFDRPAFSVSDDDANDLYRIVPRPALGTSAR